MSCYIVNDNHLSAIIRWACVNNLRAGWQSPTYAYQPGHEQDAVDLLHAANVKSVNQLPGYDKAHWEVTQ